MKKIFVLLIMLSISYPLLSQCNFLNFKQLEKLYYETLQKGPNSKSVYEIHFIEPGIEIKAYNKLLEKHEMTIIEMFDGEKYCFSGGGLGVKTKFIYYFSFKNPKDILPSNENVAGNKNTKTKKGNQTYTEYLNEKKEKENVASTLLDKKTNKLMTKYPIFAKKMDKLMLKVDQSTSAYYNQYKEIKWMNVNLSNEFMGSNDCNVCFKKIKCDLTGAPIKEVNSIPVRWMPKDLFFKYMNEKGYYVCNVHHFRDNPNYICDFYCQKESVINDFYNAKEQEKQKLVDQKKREEEQKRIQAENERKAMLATYEKNYNQEVIDAKNRANSKSGWSVIEYQDGYYIGETKTGKREGYGEFYWKHTEPIENLWEANISYVGNWSNDKYNGQGKFKYYYRKENVGLWTQVVRFYCEIQANFIIGKAEGEGYYSEKTTGFLAGSSTYDYVLYKNGAIIKNYSEENRKSNRDLIKNSDCYKFIEKTTVSYNDGGDVKTTGYKIKCIPPSKYSFEQIIYYNPGGSRYSKGWYRDDGGLLFQDGGLGANKDDTFEQVAKKSCGCY